LVGERCQVGMTKAGHWLVTRLVCYSVVGMCLLAVPSIHDQLGDVFQVGVNQLVTYLNGIVGLARIEKRRPEPSSCQELWKFI
jgi:hypothetical protein